MLRFNFDPFPVLSTERLTLRRIVDTDAEEFYRMRADKELMARIDREPAKSLDEVKSLITQINASIMGNEAITWAIALKDTNAFIGTIGFWKTDRPNHRAEIGYMLQAQHQKQGYIREAIPVMIRYGFNEMQLHSMEANINPVNLASMKVLEANGFVQEAYFSENYYYRGRFLDSMIFCLVRPD